jgi:hypothetical protein
MTFESITLGVIVLLVCSTFLAYQHKRNKKLQEIQESLEGMQAEINKINLRWNHG